MEFNPWPHCCYLSMSISFIFPKQSTAVYSCLSLRSKNAGYIPGRIYSKRESGKNLVFYDVHSGGVRLQVIFLGKPQILMFSVAVISRFG